MLIVPVLSGTMEESFSRKSQTPKPSTSAVPRITGPGAVGPIYKVRVFPGPGIVLVPSILHSFLSSRNSNRVIVRASLGAGLTVTVILAITVPPAPVAVSV